MAGRVRMRRGIILLAGMMLVLAAPALAQSKAEMQKLNDKWAEAFNKGDAATVASMYTEDAYLLPAGAEMVKGRPAIADFWRQSMQQLSDVKCTTIDVKSLGGARDRHVQLQNKGAAAPAGRPQIRGRLAEGGRPMEASARHLEHRQINPSRDNHALAVPK
jgi:uncharacterized protein (TIGR02246 family)